ncbi:MAG: hypothetical protein Tsb002_21040 [Wenzhouxiangellaceae bacterium]
MVLRLLRVQLVLAVAAVIIAAVGAGEKAAAGIALGCVFGVILNLVQALRTFALPADAEPKQMVVAFYRAAALKLLVAVILFVLAARWAPQLFGFIIAGYAITLVAHWIVGLRQARNVSQADEGQ